MEELVISNNRIQSLPAQIGQLTQLKILLSDLNALAHLPPTIGQCRSLRILNLASNNLLYLPDEIGQLGELRVLNLANNFLRFLPQSVKDLNNLSALWLNDNQKKPLIMLQQDLDHNSNTEVLTCVLFPQTGPILGSASAALAAAVMSQLNASSNDNQQHKQQMAAAAAAVAIVGAVNPHHIQISGGAMGQPISSSKLNGKQKHAQQSIKAGPIQQAVARAGQIGVKQLGIDTQPASNKQLAHMTSYSASQHASQGATAHIHHPAIAGARMLDEDEERGIDLLQTSNTLDHHSGSLNRMQQGPNGASAIMHRQSLIEMSTTSSTLATTGSPEMAPVGSSETPLYAIR